MKKLRILVPFLMLFVVAIAVGCGSTSTTSTTAVLAMGVEGASVPTEYAQRALMVGPNVPAPTDWQYDQAVVDNVTGQLCLADASNARVDFWDTTSGEYVGNVQGFTGTLGIENNEFGQVGPNGLVLDGRGYVWAGDGDGTVKVIDPTTHQVTATIVTGASKKAEAFAVDAAQGIMIVTCEAEATPCVVFVDITTYEVLGKLEFADAIGMGQPVWLGLTDKFYLPVATSTTGEVVAIDPAKYTVDSKIDLGLCEPTGMALGAGYQMLVGCATGGKPAVIDVMTGKILTRLEASTSERGIDMVAYDDDGHRYFLADTAGIRVIDAKTMQPLPTIAEGAGSHVVAVDAVFHDVFVPSDTQGVIVFAPVVK